MPPSKAHPHQRSGVVLLLALLLMAAITASTIGISVFISASTSQSKNLDDFVIASLSADSGLERSLAVIKAGRQGFDLTTTAGAANGFSSGLLPNNSSFSVAVTENSAPLFVPKLATGQALTFDILKPPPPDPLPSSLVVTGTTANGGVLDLSWVVIDNSGNTNWSGRVEPFLTATTFCLLPCIAPAINLNDNLRTETSNAPTPFNGSGPFGYRIRIRAAVGSVENITVTPYDNGSPALVPSNLAITSTGQAVSTRSVKTASILWQLPTSRLFNFAIFTEGPIIPCGSAEVSC